MKSVYSVIKASLLTEKANKLLPSGKYVFLVDRRANKIEIKKAIEKLYNVEVESVSTIVVKGRAKRIRWNQPGRTTDYKKAIVALKQGFEIKVT
jgi:large subunit ribosomal protein L23